MQDDLVNNLVSGFITDLEQDLATSPQYVRKDVLVALAAECNRRADAVPHDDDAASLDKLEHASVLDLILERLASIEAKLTKADVCTCGHTAGMHSELACHILGCNCTRFVDVEKR